MAETPKRTANRENRKANRIVLNGTAVTTQRLVTTSAQKSSPKAGAARYMRNGEEYVYHVDEKGYTMQTLQQYQRTKYLVPQAQQSIVRRNRPCLRTSTSPSPGRQSSLETQHHQSTTLNRIVKGKEKSHTPANTYLHVTANIQTAQLGQPRDHHSNINSRGHQ